MNDTASIRRLRLIRTVDEKLRCYDESVLTLFHHLQSIFPMIPELTPSQKEVEDFLSDNGDLGNRDIVTFLRLVTSVNALFGEWRALCAEFAKMPAEYRVNAVHNDIVEHFVKCNNTHGLDVARKMAGPYKINANTEFDAHEIHLIVSMSPFVSHLRNVTVTLFERATVLSIADMMGIPVPRTKVYSNGLVDVPLTDVASAFMKSYIAFHGDEKNATNGILPVNAALLPAATAADEIPRLLEENRRIKAEHESRAAAVDKLLAQRMQEP